MPSERTELDNNQNESKNTRMDIARSFENFDIRKDEISHIGRYYKAIRTMLNIQSNLKRPLRILDLGCGECYTMQLFYKSVILKKSDIVSRYIGIDIDRPMVEKTKEKRSSMLNACNGKIIVQDLTVNPNLKVKDNYFDLILCFEMVEHIKPEFLEAILAEINRVLSKKGTLLLSTPNRDGAGNNKFPKDHIYEYGCLELSSILKKHLTLNSKHGISVALKVVPKEIIEANKEILDKIYGSFGEAGRNPFTSTIIAPLIPPEYCNNVLYECSKKHKGGV
jgi:SAM-dependent methyltransferase